MSDSDEDVMYKFKIIKFKKRGRQGLTKEIDIVPAFWINWDEKTKSLRCKFLELPYSSEDITLIHEIVKKGLPAPESWPTYKVEIVGEASMCI